MKLTKKQLIGAISIDTGITKKQSAQAIRSIIENIKNNLSNKREVVLNDFGRFYVRTKKARTGRNILTGKEITIPEKKAIVFKLFKRMKDRINECEETVSVVLDAKKTENMTSRLTDREKLKSDKKKRISTLFRNAFGFLSSSK